MDMAGPDDIDLPRRQMSHMDKNSPDRLSDPNFERQQQEDFT